MSSRRVRRSGASLFTEKIISSDKNNQLKIKQTFRGRGPSTNQPSFSSFINDPRPDVTSKKASGETEQMSRELLQADVALAPKERQRDIVPIKDIITVVKPNVVSGSSMVPSIIKRSHKRKPGRRVINVRDF